MFLKWVLVGENLLQIFVSFPHFLLSLHQLTTMMIMNYRILFVCHGNICRSPMAEFVMKELVEKAGVADRFLIESAATSTEEIGNPVYPPAQRKLAEHGISCQGKTARQMRRSDYEKYDLLVGMDRWNIRNMRNMCGGDPQGKIVMLMDYTARPGDVADPWYTGDFEATWQDVWEGCQGLLEACI
jgi:protein-tyrosine phosphatase